MRFSYYVVLVFFISLIVGIPEIYSQPKSSNYKLTGRVLNARTDEAVSFATVFIDGSDRGVVCDVNGYFKMNIPREGTYNIKVRSLGFAIQTVVVEMRKHTEITVRLNEQSYSLKEVNIMAEYAPNKGSNATIERTAIEYIQPVSLLDVLLLLPGSIYGGNSVNKFNNLTSRQAGFDNNTSLGVGFISDGIPMSNDGMRTQMTGITSSNIYSAFGRQSSFIRDRETTNQAPLNAGMDMRHVSMDHVESVEVVRGISSAKVGNLSSGAIHVKSKQGRAPLQMRIKTDPLTKFIYAGKGVLISEKGGTLHIGIDALNSKRDVRDNLNEFTRITGQVNYNNKSTLFDAPLDINIKATNVFSVNNSKTDVILVENEERYNSSYLRSSLSFKGDWSLNKQWIDKLELIASADLTKDVLRRHLLVRQGSGISAMPISITEGESIGIFLPGVYYSDYSVENIPLTLLSQLNGVTLLNYGMNFTQKIIYGLEVRNTKNFGEGAVVDPTRPPFPGNNSFIRPRPNYDVPALRHGVVYVEDELAYNINRHTVRLSLGLRGTKMFNLPDSYLMSKQILIEPRIQGSLILNSTDTKDGWRNVLRVGYGQENKLPTLDLLYPDKIYRDFIGIARYTPADTLGRLLVTHTMIHNPVNENLRENKNHKYEVGWDFYCRDFEGSITPFYELSNSGFEYFQEYFNIAYIRYTNPIAPITGAPTTADFESELHKDFTLFPKATNSAKTVKKGLEYRVAFPVIKPIYTKIEVNGAYYRTLYTRGVQVMHWPTVKINNVLMPYVGIYDGDQENFLSRFNTNIWINTHVPKYKLMFSNFFQFIWFSDEQRKPGLSDFPSTYMDLDGKIHPITKEEILSDSGFLRHLDRSKSELYYRKSTKTIAIMVNMKVTKELNRYAKASFFVNNFIDINPIYKNEKLQTRRQWVLPFFGAEMMLTF